MPRRRNDGELFDVAVDQEFQVVDDELMERRNFECGHHRLRKPPKRPPCQGQPENLGRDHAPTIRKKSTTVTSENYGRLMAVRQGRTGKNGEGMPSSKQTS